MSDKIEYSKPVPPFVRFCAANIPMVFDDSLSYYEALCALWNWLQTDVIDVINNNARVTQVWREELTTFENNVTQEIEDFEEDMRKDFKDLSDLFDQLHDYVENYFENLDVQEEINNKLDEMALDGTLQEIITTYIQSNVAWTFDSVADMKLATNFTDGSFAKTFGYYSVNDGGGAFYKIRTATVDDTPDEMFLIEIGDGSLVAELVYNGNYIPEQLGAKGDGSTDASAVFAAIFDHMDENQKVIMNGTYLVTEPLYLPNKNNINLNGGTLLASNDFSGYILNTNETAATGKSGYSSRGENISIENVFFDCSYSANGIYIEQFLRIRIDGCTIQNPATVGIYCNNGHEANITNTNIIGRAYGYDDTQVVSTGIVLDTFDSIVDNCVIAYCQWAVELKRKFNQVINSHFYCNRNSGGNIKLNECSYVTLSNNYYDGSGIYAINPWQVKVNNSLFEISDNTNHIIHIQYTTSAATTRGVYINDTNVDDARTNKTDITFITCNQKPYEATNCYIGCIHLPAHITIGNPYNIFILSDSNIPMVVPDSNFAATVAGDGTMGAHIDSSSYYTYKINGNYIESTFIGSGYSWLFFKIVLPTDARITKKVFETQTGQGEIAIFKTDDTFIGYGSATLTAGEYYVGIYRNARLSIITQ